MRNIITQEKERNKHLSERGLNYLTSVPRNHIRSMLLSFSQRGSSSKTGEFSKCSGTHRTSAWHFLTKGKWNEPRLDETPKHVIFRTVEAQALDENKSIYLNIDDTVCQKPSCPLSLIGRWRETDSISFIQKRNWCMGTRSSAFISEPGHRILLRSGTIRKAHRTKVEMSKDILNSLPESYAKTFVLTDYWYTVTFCFVFVLHGIFAARDHEDQLYSLSEWLQAIRCRLCKKPYITPFSPPVTVKEKTHLVCLYEGSLNKIGNAVVLTTYPTGNLGSPQSLLAYLCSDINIRTRCS